MIKIVSYRKEWHEEVIRLMRSFEAEFGLRFNYEDLDNIEEYYQKSGGEFFICLENGNTCIGARGLTIINGFPCLRRVYVLPEWRRHKVGFLLLKAIIAFAGSKGIKKIHITTRSALTRAVAFYTQLGCERPKEVQENCPTFGDNVFFEYRLD